MSILSRIADHLPASKRAIRDLRSDVYELYELNRSINARIEQADNGINDNLNFRAEWLKSDNDGVSMRIETMLWQLYRNDNEDLQDAKKRFFISLPKANGGLRAMQLGCAKLLGEFDTLCKDNNLQYWIAFGTLLGAIRHQGFIPWDDDSDLGMMRSEINKLINIVSNDGRYRISIVYDVWNFCKQIRFMYEDVNNPCFLDLFIFEESRSADKKAFEEQLGLRMKMIAEMKTASYYSEWKEKEFIPASDPLANRIEETFAKYRSIEMSQGIIDDQITNGMLWGIENIYFLSDYKWACQKREVFPTQTISFERILCQAPKNLRKFTEDVYGDIYRVPMDITTHCEHVSKEQLRALENQEL